MLRQKRQQQQQPKPIRWGLKKICWGLINITVPRHAPRSWIEANFQKRDCVKFIPSTKEETRCCCGQARTTHPTIAGIEAGLPGDVWVPFKHTRSHPTDAYGTIEFQGGAHPTKAQYVRLSYDTRPELLVQLFQKEWNLELPKLLITVQGGKANFELQPKLKKEIRKGLLKAAKTTGAWVFTGGTNTGVTKQVGDALLLEGQQKTGRVVSIGIAPWGIVERNHELLGHNRDVPCHSISSPRSKLAVLNNRHAYFLLVDNGSQGRYGAELILRRKLEKFISNLKLYPFTHSCTPVVCLVIEGGTNTIRAVLEYVTDSPPVPVVVCDGSGRAADLIAFVHKYASDDEEQPVLESMRDSLIQTIQKTFEVGFDQAECLYQELLQCTRNKNLITVYRIHEKPEGGDSQELDQTILTALFKSQHLSPSEQLSLALTWNRVDIARSEIFVYGQEWQHGALDEAMMRALEHDRIDFVKLLLENGVSMKKFLTIPRLEELYNTKHGPANTMGYILRDVRPHIPRGYVYTLHDIGLVINKLMGGAYRSYYTRRKFRPIYAKVMNSYVNTYRKSSTFQRHPGANSMSLVTGLLPFTSEMALFQFPFNELLIWAVLTKRQEMALLMWEHGEEALAKSLVACKLYKALAHEAAEDDLDTEIYDELKTYAKEFEAKGIRLLDFCYRQDADRAQRLLTCELQSWSSQSCLSLAVAANHRPLLAHSCSQVILADLWMGGLRTRKNTNLKVILGLMCPPFIMKLDFKSKEELQSMPQTEEEHIENQNLDYEDLEKTNADAENPLRHRKSISSKYDHGRKASTQALLAETYPMKDTQVQENGKVSLADTDLNRERENLPVFCEYDDLKQHRPLRLKKKVYEFYTAPITKFWADSIAYMLFLMFSTYTVLVQMSPTPSWQEMYCIAYITTLGCEKVREIISSEPVAVSHKFSVWAWNMWNPCDAAAIIFFLIGLTLRFKASTMDIGRVFYCVDSVYWYLRILNILGVNKYLGPLVTMMGKMVKNMIYFVVLLLVVLLSFGVSRQAILHSEREASWLLIKDVFYQPYFMLYGEVFADDIDPPCGESKDQQPCVVARPIAIIMMSLFLLVANILLINLLIAVFNNIFIEVNAVSHQVWMFQRFTVVMQYQQKPVLPPPLIAVSHCYSLFKFLVRKAKGLDLPRDNGLKLFLEKDDMERLYDFEEECVEGYVREQEVALLQSTDERIRATSDRVEHMTQKVEDLIQKQNVLFGNVQNIDFRQRKLEDCAEQIQSTLAVIHRFMSAHTSLQEDGCPLHGSSSNLSSDFRARTVSDAADRPNSRAVLKDNFLSKTAAIESQPSPVTVGTERHLLPLLQSSSAAAAAAGPPAALLLHALRHQDTTSTESKDTLTPHEATDDRTLVDDDESEENIAHLNFDAARQKALRRRSVCRRNSESCELNRSQTSLNAAGSWMARRQRSLTQSEPESGNEQSAKTVINVKQSRNVLLKLHSEYTSITDELENVCQMIASPTLSHGDSGGGGGGAAGGAGAAAGASGDPSHSTSEERPHHGGGGGDSVESAGGYVNPHLSNAAIAALAERKHLKECEENDYMILSKLFQGRHSVRDDAGAVAAAVAAAAGHYDGARAGDDAGEHDIDDDDDDDDDEYGFGDCGATLSSRYRRAGLHRGAAVELPVTPSRSMQSTGAPAGSGAPPPPPYAQLTTQSADVPATVHERHTGSTHLLIPSLSEPTAQFSMAAGRARSTSPFASGGSGAGQRVLRHQTSSTDTEEYALHPYCVIKQSSNDTNASLTEETTTTTTAAYVSNESLNRVPSSSYDANTAATAAAAAVRAVPPAPLLSGSSVAIQGPNNRMAAAYSPKEMALGVVVSAATSAVVIAMPPPLGSGSGAAARGTLHESSSTSTEDEQQRIVLPRISTLAVQDEIAQMSTNIGYSSSGSGGSSSGSGAGSTPATAGAPGSGRKELSRSKAVAEEKENASHSETMC